jgi:autotransporter-associated beta strand protein
MKRQMVLSAAVLAGLGVTRAQAASLYWDVDGTATGTTGGSGAWTTGNWNQGAANGPDGVWTDGNDAVLGGTAGTVTIGGTPVVANSLEFANGAGTYIVDGGSLTVPTIKLDSATSQFIRSTLTGPLTVLNNTGGASGVTLSIAGTDAGGAALPHSIGTLNIGAGFGFDKPTRIEFESNLASLNLLSSISQINFLGNYGMLSVSFPPVTGAEVHETAPVNVGLGNYALLAAAGGVRFHFSGAGVISGQGGVAIVDATPTATRANASTGAVVFDTPQAYTGPTRIMMSSVGLLRFRATNALPVLTDLIFGGGTTSSVGGVNLNGMDTQVGSLSSEPGVTSFGLQNNGSHGSDPTVNNDDGSAIFTINGSADPIYANTTFAGQIGQAGATLGVFNNTISLVRPLGSTGSTTLTNGTSQYAQGTTINGGAIISRNTTNNGTSSPVGTGFVSVGGNGNGAGQFGTFGGTGQVIGLVTNNQFGRIQPAGALAIDIANPLTLNGGLDLKGGSTVAFDFNGFGNDRIDTTNLIIPDNTGTNVQLVVNDLGSGVRNGTFTLIDYSSLAGSPGAFDYSKLQVVAGTGVPGGAVLTLDAYDNDKVKITVTGVPVSTDVWKATNSAIWDEGNPGTVNWNNGAPTKFFNGDIVNFDDTASQFGVTVQGAGVSPLSMAVSASTDYSFSVGSISAFGLTKTNTGKLTFDNTATFSGGTNVSGFGTLAIGPTGVINGGAITVTNSTLAVSASGNLGTVPSVSLTDSTLRADGTATVSKPISVAGLSNTIDTNGNALTISGAISGTVPVLKTGTGTLTLSGASPSSSGLWTVSQGTVSMTFADANGFTGIGSTGGNGSLGTIVSNGATLNYQNVRQGYLSTGAQNVSGTNGGNINPKNGSTISWSGESGNSVGAGGKGITFANSPVNGAMTITLDSGNSFSRFAVRNFLKQENLNGTATTVEVKGQGIFQIASASQGTATTSGATQYQGSWLVNMGSNGVFSFGPLLNGGGEVLTGIGYTPGTPFGPTKPVTVQAGTFAIGVDRAHDSTNVRLSGAVRSPITLSGGNIASTGREYDGPSTASNPASATPVTGKFSADITLAAGTTSKVLLYDPVPLGNYTGVANPAAAGATPATNQNYNPTGPRSVRFISEVITGANTAPVSSNFTWGAGSTLVLDSGAEVGGGLRFERTAGTVSVGANATLQINAGGTAQLTGTVEALKDSSSNTYVNVVNNSVAAGGPFPWGLWVTNTAGTQNVGTVSGTGNTVVEGGGVGSTLVATHFRQNSVTIGGQARVRAIADPTSSASVMPGVSVLNSLVISGAGKINLTNNRIITNDAQGTESGGTYSGILGQVQSGRTGGPGIFSDQPLVAANQTAVGVATAAESKSLLAGQTTMWSGRTVDDNDTLVMYTWAGDANLDGKVNADDYASIDLYSTVPGADTWNHGDFNYNGVINADDYALIDNNVQNLNYVPYWTTDALRNLEGGGESATAGLTAVPEPASLGLLMVSAAGLLGRRRRKV